MSQLVLCNPVGTSQTTVAVQRYLHELADLRDETPAEPLIRALLARSANRLHQLCAGMLYRRYRRLTRGPMNLCPEEMLSAVVERLLRAVREVRPPTVRQFFALANRHMRWELNDLARHLDHQVKLVELRSSWTAAPPATELPDPRDEPSAGMRRILTAINDLPPQECEVFTLVRIQGMTHAEAAEVMAVSTKTVQRRLNSGLALLSESLKDLRALRA